MEIKRIHIIGLIAGVLIMISSLFFLGKSFLFFILGIGVIVGALPFVFTLMKETKESSQKEAMFLEFVRNLVESVNTGTPISKSIINVKRKSYGVLDKHIEKLGNQISLGIPLNVALQTFSKDIGNPNISRALTLIGQAEKAGGDIGEILESVADAVSMTDKLKKERKAAISTLVVQGYIIFLVFITIVLIMQFKILPMLGGIGSIGIGGGAGVGGISSGAMSAGTGGEQLLDQSEMANAFLYLLLIQGFFSGLAIGKLSEGSIKAGVRHSFSLMLISFFIFAAANLFFGGG